MWYEMEKSLENGKCYEKLHASTKSKNKLSATDEWMSALI